MEYLFVPLLSLAIILLISIILPWVNFARLSRLRSDINKLQEQIHNLQPGQAKARATKAAAVVEKKAKVVQSPSSKGLLADQKITSSVSKKVKKPTKTDSKFELDIATKLPVWIGSASLIFAAFFLVKYSIDLGWVGPVVRVWLGGFFGIALLIVGQWLVNRKQIANSTRIAQGLVGAGLVALYVSIYAAFALYGLIAPLTGFIGMFFVTTITVILSLCHGQPIAAFGLVGGLLTPTLVGTDDPNALGLFVYLFILFSGLFAVLVHKKWWTLAIISLAGVLSWAVLWFMTMYTPADDLVILLFPMALTATVLSITGRKIAGNEKLSSHEHMQIHGLNCIAIAGGVITVIALGLVSNLSLFDWSMLGLLNIALMTLSYFRPKVYQLPLIAILTISLGLFFAWAQRATLFDEVSVILGFALIYLGGSSYMMRKVRDPRLWAYIQVGAALSLYTLSYFALDLPVPMKDNFFWGGIGVALAGLTAYQLFDIFKSYKADKSIREQLLRLYTLTISAFFSLAIAIELPMHYLPIAIALQIAATAWISQRYRIDSLQKVMFILSLVFIALHIEQILLFLSLALTSVDNTATVPREVKGFVLSGAVFKLGIPAVFMTYSLWTILQQKAAQTKLINTLSLIVSGLFLAVTYYLLRTLFQPEAASIVATQPLFIERGLFTLGCALGGMGILTLADRYKLPSIKMWGRTLFIFAMVRFTLFDLVINNPYWSESQNVGSLPFINGVTLIYGMAVLLSLWAVGKKEFAKMRNVYMGLSFAGLFALASLTVRQLFHGGNLYAGEISFAEYYSYSAAWLITGIGVLVIGIIKKNKMARMGSLGFLLLAVIKVFIFDTQELEGLYRIFSFLGLGVSLIGLSYFYTKYVFKPVAKRRGKSK